MENKKEVTIDPKTLREECLSFGLFMRVCQDVVEEQGGKIDEKVREGILLLGGAFLYGNAVSNPPFAFYLTALAYEQRKFETSQGKQVEIPPWHEGEESEAERFSDAFLALYSLFLSQRTDMPTGELKPEDYLGPVEFFAGAVKEDIAEALNKKKGDPHYDAFHTEITSYPFSLNMKVTALNLYKTVHPEEA